MDALVRLRLRPLGVWTTPWQADSLLGALACSWMRSRGQAALRNDLLEPWLAGQPPFVLSDAFPGDALPVPAGVPVWWEWSPEQRKAIKKRRWTTLADFRRIQRQEKQTTLEETRIVIRDQVRLRNSISRATDTTGDGGTLFEVPYSHLSRQVVPGAPTDDFDIIDTPDGHLAVYVRASSRGMDILLQALEMLGRTGYGADATTGHGGFERLDEVQSCPELSDVPGADGFISLSTYQPATGDPTDGFWRVFVKYGKLAPEFHDRGAIFKRPQVMLEAGACFRTAGPPKPFYGGPIAPDRLLSPPDQHSLAEIGVHPVQAAFGLAVPTRWPVEERADRPEA